MERKIGFPDKVTLKKKKPAGRFPAGFIIMAIGISLTQQAISSISTFAFGQLYRQQSKLWQGAVLFTKYSAWSVVRQSR